VSYGRADNLKFLSDISYRFTPTRQIERLTDPLGDRHMTRARHALDFSVLWISYNYLKPLSHCMSLSDSSR